MRNFKLNTCTLNIGGAERTLKFSMETCEFYLYLVNKLSEFDNLKNKKVDSLALDVAGKAGLKKINIKKDSFFSIDNPFTQIKVLIYCGLVIADPTLENLSYEECSKWISDCDDERFEQANEFALETMGFILSVEQSQFHRQMEKIQSMGMNPSEILEKALSSKS